MLKMLNNNFIYDLKERIKSPLSTTEAVTIILSILINKYLPGHTELIYSACGSIVAILRVLNKDK